MQKRLQNHIAESRFALPFTAVLALVVCGVAGWLSAEGWPNLVLLGLATYVMVEINNSLALLRIPSRMVSCTFLVMNLLVLNTFDGDYRIATAQLMFALTLLILFHTYQDRNAPGRLFYTFLLLGVAIMAFPPMVLYVPVVWFIASVFVMCLTPRTLFASLLGLLTPFWIALGYCALTGSLSFFYSLAEYTQSFIAPFTAPDTDWRTLFSEDAGYVGMRNVPAAVLIVICLLIGSIHFFANSYQDKIRTRMFYQSFVVLALFTIALMVLLPQASGALIHPLIICSAPFFAHFAALTHSKMSNVLFIVCILLAVVIMGVKGVEGVKGVKDASRTTYLEPSYLEPRTSYLD